MAARDQQVPLQSRDVIAIVTEPMLTLTTMRFVGLLDHGHGERSINYLVVQIFLISTLTVVNQH